MIKNFFKKLNIKAGLLQRFAFRNDNAHTCHPEQTCHPELVSGSCDLANGNKDKMLKLVQHDSLCKKIAFTLAEVLITIGIIGVVAAMTIPAIHGAILKHRVETSLKKFNSTMNNALRLYVAENGDLNVNLAYAPRDPSYASYEENLKILNTYFLPYIKYSNVEKNKIGQYGAITNLSDGSSFFFVYNGGGGDIIYCIYPYNSGKCKKGKTSFQFQFSKVKSLDNPILNSANSVEPYIFAWNGTENGLKTDPTWGCGKAGSNNGYCTKIIQLNNWKIPKDYPIKF